MGKLAKWAKDNSDFLRIRDGETAHCKFLKADAVPNRFDPEREVIRYILEVDGQEKSFESGSLALAEQMDVIKAGEWVKIKRTDQGRSVRYDVEKVEESEDVNPNEVDLDKE